MRAPALFVLLALALTSLLYPALSLAQEARPKVLVVMSYHESYTWSRELAEGIESVLTDADITWFWLDTKLHLDNGPAMAAEAFTLFQSLAPDGVIAADDNAQSLFVVPYLKDSVDTPVVFCGVNADPAVYGYPAANVTGVRERFLICETLALLKELAPDVERIAFLMRGGVTTTDLLLSQMQNDMAQCPMETTAMVRPETLAEAVALAGELAADNDVLFVEHVEGLPDAQGLPVSSEQALEAILAGWGQKPTVCGFDFMVQAGALCSVTDSGQEQGALAAGMLLDILGGKAVADIPMTVNTSGGRVVNAATLEALGLTLPPGADAELVGAP